MTVYASNLIHAESVRPPGGGDWLGYYTRYLDTSGFRDYIRRRLGGICPGCWQDGIDVGAVVGFLSWDNRRAYIAPLCRRCSRRTESPISLPSDLLCVPLPAEAENIGDLRYPAPAVAYLRMLHPRESLQWDGHPISTPPRRSGEGRK